MNKGTKGQLGITVGVLRNPGDEEHMPLDLGVLIRVLDEHSKEMKEVTAENVTPRVCFFRPRRWARPSSGGVARLFSL